MGYLAGDIGGTKTHLALYQEQEGKLLCLKQKKFPSKDYLDLKTIVSEFLNDEKTPIVSACFGIAGPVRKGKSQTTNLPWLVDTTILEKTLKIKKVALINDLEANAYGIQVLSDEEFYTLNDGKPDFERNQALISAGTGLGEAGVFFDGKRLHPFGCEGGHGDFAPINPIQDELLSYLRKKFGHVSYERVLSGPGIYNIYEFLITTKKEKENEEILREIQEGNSPRLISEYGLQRKSVACRRTLEIFSSIYGAEAGNLALTLYALGGVFVGGGIAPKILDILKEGSFMEGFIKKGRFDTFLSTIPVKVVLNEQTALLGALHYAKNFM